MREAGGREVGETPGVGRCRAEAGRRAPAMVTVWSPDGGRLGIAAAPEWNGLFARVDGWTGGDGIYTVPLSGDESPGAAAHAPTLLLFGDTFIGTVAPDGARVAPRMVNNTMAILTGGVPEPAQLRFCWGKAAAGMPASMVVPRTRAALTVPGSYYWLQDGIVVGRTFYCFPMVVAPDPTGPEGFQFALHGVVRVAVPVAQGGADLDWRQERQVDAPLFYRDAAGCRVYFGAALCPNTHQAGAPQADGFVYCYGLRQVPGGMGHQLVVARVAEAAFAAEDFAAWRYWDGSRWVPERERVAPVAPAVSPECSVSPLIGGWWDGRWALVSLLGDTVSLCLGPGPIGPFSPALALYRCPESNRRERADGVYVYNAKAHPHLARPGELLISYNVNTTRWDVHLRRADVYRPRFLRVRAI